MAFPLTRQDNVPRFKKRSSSLASLLLLLLGVFARPLSAQGPGSPIQFTDEDIQNLVDAVNGFRGRVDPPAANMQALVWNDELANVAQSYSQRCIFDDQVTQAPSLAIARKFLLATETPNFTHLIENAWFDQRSSYNYEQNSCSEVCGDYTQLVWATTTSIGCGATKCPSIPGFPDLYSLIFVCNFGPGDNLTGRRPYTSGTSCSGCQPEQTCVSNVCTSGASETCTEEEVRLQDGTETEGRLEVCHDGEWGTVCDNNFNKPEASLVCRKLGLKGAEVLKDVAPGKGKIWMSGLRCFMRSKDLFSCRQAPLGENDCTHDQDVGVQCKA